MQRWGEAAQVDRPQRIAAAVLAVALTSALFGVLQPAAQRRPGAEAHTTAVAYIRVVPPAMTIEPPRTAQQPTAPRTEPAPSRPRLPAAQSPRAATIAPTPITPTPDAQAPLASASPASAVENSPVEGAASEPFALDSAALRAAVKAAKSPIRRMADASGAYFGDTTVSAQGRLARSMAQGAKSDCLAPDENGSLLSVFIISSMFFSDKCK